MNETILKLNEWFLAQCGRDDSVGKLARYYVNESAGNRIADCEKWLLALEVKADWRAAVGQVRKEHAVAVDYIKRGENAPTFPKLFASEQYNKMLDESFAKHKDQKDLSADAYLRRKHFGLQNALEGRSLIYLDTNHWMQMRHVWLETRFAKDDYAEILFLINDLALKGLVLCPISFPLFLELMKQNDPKTRFATTTLMQTFSGGVCFQVPGEIERLELRQRAFRTVLGAEAPDLKEWIWTKVGYLAGEMLPFNNSFSEETNNLVRKVCIDNMWSLSLQDFVEFDSNDWKDDAETLLATAANMDSTFYREKEIPYQEALKRETANLVRPLIVNLKKIALELWNDYPNHRDISARPPIDTAGFDPRTLPSVQVLAGINAALKVSTKKFVVNDILDFQHAALAVPYCDALFCDRPMAHVLCNKPLEFDKIYKTVVISQPNEIIRFLQNLKQSPKL